MPEQRLPRVKSGIFDSIAADSSPEKIEEWIVTLAIENPQLLVAVDAIGRPGSLIVVATIYALLNSQAEANEMNEDFK